MKRLVVAVAFTLSVAANAASNHDLCTPNCYVATNGNDNTGNGTIGSPWQTWYKCFNEAYPGDTCWIRGGTYEAPDISSSQSDNGYGGWSLGIPAAAAYFTTRTGHGGALGNHVIIRGYPGEVVRFTQDTGNICKDQITGHDNQVAYLTFLDLTFVSGRMFFGDGGHHITFERCIFKSQTSAPFHDNPAMLMSGANTVTSCGNWIVRNNLFISDSTDTNHLGSCTMNGGQEQWFVEFYSWNNGLLENNDFIMESNSGNSNFGGAIGFKGWNTTSTIRNNYVSDRTANRTMIRGIWFGNMPNTSNSVIYKNIIVGTQLGIMNDGVVDSHDNDYYNNTFYNVKSCWTTLTGAGEHVRHHEFFNNICVSGSDASSDLYFDFGWWSDDSGGSVSEQTLLDYNIYWKLGSGNRRWKNLSSYTSDTGGIAAWQTYLDGQGVPTFETNSRLIDPGLTNPGAGDFRLAVGAAARSGGRGDSYPTWLGADDPNSTADYVGCSFDPRCHSYSAAGDTDPPSRFGGLPAGILASGTTSTTISLNTNEAATCKYSTTPPASYAAMANTFSTTGGTSHSQAVGGLVDGGSYSYYVRCTDSIPNANTDDYIIVFQVSTPTASPTTLLRGAKLTGGKIP